MLKIIVPSLVVAAFFCSASPAIAQQFPDGPGKEILERECSSCHAPDMVTSYRRTVEEWKENILSMNDLGGATSAENVAILAEYLAKHWGRTESPAPAPAPPAAEPSADAIRPELRSVVRR